MFWQKLLRGIAMLPVIITGIEPLFGKGTGDQKRESALGMLAAIIGMAEAVSGKDIVDDKAFQEGIRKMVDGAVQVMNASVWAKKP